MLKRLILILTSLALVASACGSDGGDTASTTTAPAKQSVLTTTTAAPAAPSGLGDGSLGTVEVGAGEAIQIRSLNAISGDVAFLGIPNENGIRMAVEDYGQIHGHDVEVGTGLDDLCSADGGQAAAQTIVADEDVIGVIGTSCSGAATAASPLISAAGMVMVSGSNTSPALTSDLAGTAGPNYHVGYYRTAHNDLYQGQAAANFALEVLGVSSAAAIHDGDPYTEGLARAFADAFEAGGGTLTGFTAVNKGDTDMVPVLTEIAAGSPDLLFFPIFQPEGDFIIQQSATVSGLGGTVMMAADGLLNSNYLAVSETEGMYFSGPDVRYGANFNESTGATAADVLADYEAEFGEAPAAPFWAHSYDAAALLMDAILAASTDDGGTLVIDRAGVREYLNGVSNYSGLIGSMSCDAFGDCSSAKITVIQNTDIADYAASTANVVYEYAPLGGQQVGEVAVPVARTASWRGVTEDEIHVGVTMIDFPWLIEMGLSTEGWGDPQTIWEALLGEVNGNGGVWGRQIVVDGYRFYSPVPGMGISAEGVCLELASDIETFAIIGGFLGPAEISNTCITATANTILIGGRQTTEGLAESTAPWLEFGTMKERRMDVYLSLLDQEGLLEGRTFALVGGMDGPYETAKELITGMGIDLALDAFNDVTVGDTEAEDARWDVLVENVRSSGADTIFLVGGERAGIRNLSYAGIDIDMYVMNSETYTSLSASVTPEMADGGITLTGMTPEEQWETEGTQACAAAFREANPDIETSNPTDWVEGEKWYTGITNYCNWVAVLVAVLEAAGPNPTHESFLAGVESMTQFYSPSSPYSSFGPGKYDASDSFRLSVFDGSEGAGEDGLLTPMGPVLDGTP